MNNFDNTKTGAGARVAFVASTAMLLYTVVGYPLLVAAISRLRPRPVSKKEGQLPKVSIIIAAYNEEAAIHQKLENTFDLDYPSELMEVIVASDCSSDRTDEIVRAHPRCDGGTWGSVRVCRLPERGGKTSAQNLAAQEAQGEIIVFSDATSDYEPNVLKVIVPNFADPKVGCVSGRMIYVDPSKSSVGSGAQSYWNYEVFIKKCESQIFSLIGVSGLLYAVRRSAFRPLPVESSSDFVIATDVVSQGYRVIFEPDAICREETNQKVGRELKMRTRIITQTYYDLWWMRSMLNPLRSGFYAVQLWSHKVFRYAVPLFLLINAIASLRLAQGSKFHRALVNFQTLICVAALMGSLLERTCAQGNKITKLLAVPRYFLFNNAAPFLALWNVLRGERYAKWDTARQPTPETSLPAKEGEK
jgi:cellulose synthase/poly-beta-1,6-N-acetylglucosamine synthase-like glycosyltransferase